MGDQDFEHIPVLLAETTRILAAVPAGWVLDATVGGGGHSARLLEETDHISIIGLDQDPAAIAAAEDRLRPFGNRARLERSRFDDLDDVCARNDIDTLAGFLFDLGVSSPQLDRADRGFSFRHDGPLDMRMDPDANVTAADIVNTWSVESLTRVLREYSDERFADRVARAIVAHRPHVGTSGLAAVVVDAIPAATRRRGGHPAKRTFQAIRIAVNHELEVLEPAIASALDRLAVGGRGVVLTYHSGEDRIVKNLFRVRTTSAGVPGLPPPPGAEAKFRLLRPSSIRPSPSEEALNPRAASARLRGIERVAA